MVSFRELSFLPLLERDNDEVYLSMKHINMLRDQNVDSLNKKRVKESITSEFCTQQTTERSIEIIEKILSRVCVSRLIFL